jgi:hypothetical protein
MSRRDPQHGEDYKQPNDASLSIIIIIPLLCLYIGGWAMVLFWLKLMAGVIGIGIIFISIILLGEIDYKKLRIKLNKWLTSKNWIQ